MSTVEANITIDLPDGFDISDKVQSIRAMISDVNGLDTHINVIEIDDPISMSPINIAQIK